MSWKETEGIGDLLTPKSRQCVNIDNFRKTKMLYFGYKVCRCLPLCWIGSLDVSGNCVKWRSFRFIYCFDFSESLEVLLTFSLDNGCRNGIRGPQCCYLYHTRHNLRPHEIVDTIVKIVAIVCLFLSSLALSRKLLSVIKRHYNPLPDIYLGTTPFLFSSLFQS